jgi:uncharacterized membrane protein
MAELVVIGYRDERTAQAVMVKLHELERDLIVQLAGSAVVVKGSDGQLQVTTPTHATGMGAATGAIWGTIIGLLFFIPIGGMLIGGAMGALFGKMNDLGVKDEFKQQVIDMLQPGAAAVVMLFQKATPDKTMAALQPFGGTVLKTSLTNEAELHLQEALSQTAAL